MSKSRWVGSLALLVLSVSACSSPIVVDDTGGDGPSVVDAGIDSAPVVDAPGIDRLETGTDSGIVATDALDAVDAGGSDAADVGSSDVVDAGSSDAADVGSPDVADAGAPDAADVGSPDVADAGLDAGGDVTDASVPCLAPRQLCGVACVSTSTDATNCGSCGAACPMPANGTATCAASTCGVVCNTGFHDCSGICVSDHSVLTCGAACTASCATPTNGVASCDGTACGVTCDPGFHACGASCPADTDATACGTSCVHCAVPANGVATCTSGACGITCNTGYTARLGACVVNPPRAVAPLSTETVTTRTPTLHWVLPDGVTAAHVEVYADRAHSVLQWASDVTGSSVAVSPSLPVGVWYWRLFGRDASGNGTVGSPTWQFTVPGTHSAPVSTSWGSGADFDGDGYSEVVISTGGQTFIYAGGPGGTSTIPSNRFTGYIEAYPAGDVDGDGFGDLLANCVAADCAYAGVSVFRGSATGLPFAASFTLTGAYANEPWGDGPQPLAAAGDVNGDGYADIIADSPHAFYVFNGSPAGTSTLPSETLSAPVSASARFAYNLSGAGDLNGDGFADVIASDFGAGGSVGAVYVYYGSSSGLSATPPVILHNPRVDLAVAFGTHVSGAGDANGDGYSDIVIGSQHASGTAGAAFVFYGGLSGVTTTGTTLLGPSGAANYGESVAFASDVNADGFSDVLVGDQRASVAGFPGLGAAFLFLGASGGVPSSPSLSIGNAIPARGTCTASAGLCDYQGMIVAGAGDVNRDGRGDFISYAAGISGVGGSGIVAVYLGSTTTLAVTPALTLPLADESGLITIAWATVQRLRRSDYTAALAM